ncbi:MAG TPA: DNA topology modulation protein [Gammaproteobacteria bacterium]|nr:DNA topology modulation protein [Gammaproteobacteria bacterium]
MTLSENPRVAGSIPALATIQALTADPAQVNTLRLDNMDMNFKKIMIFGRPGSGKSTFASSLACVSNLPLHHLDKHFYAARWTKRNYDEFLSIQKNIVNSNAWIIDGNCTSSFEMRWSKADLVLYFNFPKVICYFRILKRFFKPNKMLDDRASGCYETIRFSLLKYIWSFEERVSTQVALLKEKYPDTVFREIKSKNDLSKLNQELTDTT